MVANDVIPDSYKYGYGVNKKKVKSNFFKSWERWQKGLWNGNVMVLFLIFVQIKLMFCNNYCL